MNNTGPSPYGHVKLPHIDIGLNETRERLLTRYQIDFRQPIGKGSFGKVFNCKLCNSSKKLVCKEVEIEVKRLEIENESERRLNLLKREIDILRLVTKINHENLIGLEDDCIYVAEEGDKRLYYMIQERMDKNLLQYLLEKEEAFLDINHVEKKESFLDINQVKNIAMKIGIGIQCLHSKNIIHRDLKPENIMIKYLDSNQTDFQVKIIDYGLAREMTNYGLSNGVGTNYYMAPEVKDTKRNHYTLRADMWSFGVILYNLMTFSSPKFEDGPNHILKFEDSSYHFNLSENPQNAPINRGVIERLLCDKEEGRLTIDAFLKDPFCPIPNPPRNLPPPERNPNTHEPKEEMLMLLNHNDTQLKLSTFGFQAIDDPTATILTSYIPSYQPVSTSGEHHNSSLGQVVDKFHTKDIYSEWTEGMVSKVDNAKSNLIKGEEEQMPFRDLFYITIDRVAYNKEKNYKLKRAKCTWDIYSNLLREAKSNEFIAKEDTTNFYMSFLGYYSHDEEGYELTNNDKKKLYQYVTKEIANFVVYLAKTENASKLKSVTIFVKNQLFDDIKESFQALGISGAINMIFDDIDYLHSKSKGIFQNKTYSSNIQEFIKPWKEKLDSLFLEDKSGCDLVQKKICIFGSEIAQKVKETKENFKEPLEREDRFAFILDEDHAIDILEETAYKVISVTTHDIPHPFLFDAITTLVAIEYVVEYIAKNEEHI